MRTRVKVGEMKNVVTRIVDDRRSDGETRVMSV